MNGIFHYKFTIIVSLLESICVMIMNGLIFVQTTQDCVLYYYLSKMSANYKQLVRRHLSKRRTKLQKVGWLTELFTSVTFYNIFPSRVLTATSETDVLWLMAQKLWNSFPVDLREANNS